MAQLKRTSGIARAGCDDIHCELVKPGRLALSGNEQSVKFCKLLARRILAQIEAAIVGYAQYDIRIIHLLSFHPRFPLHK
jgi:hypothetical protein